jgi:hypothetical protein
MTPPCPSMLHHQSTFMYKLLEKDKEKEKKAHPLYIKRAAPNLQVGQTFELGAALFLFSCLIYDFDCDYD